MKSREELRSILEGLTLAEFLILLGEAKYEYGAAGSLFVREDAASAWRDIVDDLEMRDKPCGMGADLPDEAWERITETYEWRKALDERLCEVGWGIVHDAVWEVFREMNTEALQEGK